MKSIGVAVIGLGYWGPNLVRNFASTPGAELLYGCDLDQKLCDKIASGHPGVAVTTDYAKVLADDNVQLVAIATPVATHYKLAKLALEAGKHVFVEKPMTQTSEQSAELLQLAQDKGLLIGIDHPFVFSGVVKTLQDLISSGDIGNVLYYDSVRINLGLFRSDVNVIWDLLPHDLSILAELFPDKPTSVQAVGLDHFGRSNEDVAYVTLRYPQNITAHIHVSWTSPVKIRQMILGGTKKMVVVDDVAPDEKLKIYDRGVDQEAQEKEQSPFQPLYRSGNVVIPKLDSAEPLADECRNVIAAIRGQEPLRATGAVGHDIVRILEATDRSLAEGGIQIEL